MNYQDICIKYNLNTLSNADLHGADLAWADLFEADLHNADLAGANLHEADLRKADLRKADLREANLRKAVLFEADLTNARLPAFQIVPEEGAFIGYKKVYCNSNPRVIKLLIPATAKRTSTLVGRKCRASEAKVIEGLVEGETAHSLYKPSFTYELNQVVTEPDYDDDIRVECTRGIHFFITYKEAKEY